VKNSIVSFGRSFGGEETREMSEVSRNTPAIDDEEILSGIRRWVEIETPSPDGEAVNRLADVVQSEAGALGGQIDRIPGRNGYGDILTVRSPWGGDEPGILILSHLDTVHAVGTLEHANPFRRDGDRVYGPGIFDMKSGAYLAFYAFQHLVRSGQETPLPLTYLYVPEEEIGSPTSRQVIEDTAKKTSTS
jgi:glutamate carboxypeptidase